MTGGIAQKVNDPHGSPSESCCFIRPLKPSVSVSIAEDQLLLLIYSVFTCLSRHLLSLNPLQARCRRYSRGER
ncbi:hypothetical protein MBD73_004999 [Escherichia coli]|nr:hypothetical protein [Escherichia coli]EFC0561961.1 hypothetical protein [Escherichia coli O157:H7]EER7618339.1 hypothetical protein [Escherichia coli]EES5968777.1 hypothetical protein [Escherichia coli]EEZ8243301.1 hypothetical protein [Escherichia coli]